MKRQGFSAMYKALLLIALILSGCTETRTDTQAQTVKQDHIAVSGNMVLPQADGSLLTLPLSFTVERNGSEDQAAHTDSKTQIDAQAIAQQTGAIVGKLVDAGIAKLTGIQATSKPWGGVTPTETGAAGLATTAAAMYLREMLARKREEQRVSELKQSRDKLHEQSVELAKQIPAPSTYVDHA
jgi:hypothetical protein